MHHDTRLALEPETDWYAVADATREAIVDIARDVAQDHPGALRELKHLVNILDNAERRAEA